MFLQADETRPRLDADGGFTLVELLIVMLILGALAAIAIPSFFNQADKAKDADAKAVAKTAQNAIEAYSTEMDNRYLGVDVDDLYAIETTLPPGAPLAISNLGVNTYTLTVSSKTGTDFSITRLANGGVRYECSVEASGGCPDGGEWG